MKNTLRTLSVLFALVLCFGLLSACGNSNKPTETDSAPDSGVTTAPTGTEPFVAPADQIGCVVSADSTLVTWNVYETEDETIDFMGINIKALGDADEEMSLFYLEDEVTYYRISEGKLVDATIEDVIPGCVIGITTLEEGVQEVYIIHVPVEDDGSDDYDDSLEEIVEDTVPETTAATEEATPEDSDVSNDSSYEGSSAEDENVEIDN